jgi:hypothetical protein
MNKSKGEKRGGGGVNSGMLAKKGDQDRGKFLCISPGAHLSSVSGTAFRILGQGLNKWINIRQREGGHRIRKKELGT